MSCGGFILRPVVNTNIYIYILSVVHLHFFYSRRLHVNDGSSNYMQRVMASSMAMVDVQQLVDAWKDAPSKQACPCWFWEPCTMLAHGMHICYCVFVCMLYIGSKTRSGLMFSCHQLWAINIPESHSLINATTDNHWKCTDTV